MSGIACVGECMLELTNLPNGDFRMAYGGDTLNTAVYMARLGSLVRFITAVGNDAYSANMLAGWQSENVGSDTVFVDDKHSSGLYAIQTDEHGERSFNYWRSDSAAKHLFHSSDSYHALLASFDMVYFSGITLSLMSDTSFDALLKRLSEIRKEGVKVVFDLNYRPKNWHSAEAAKSRIDHFLQVVDIALPSFDDEQLLFDDKDVDTCIQRYRSCGVSEIVLKHGENGCYVSTPLIGDKRSHSIQHFPVKNLISPIDTTAAGDSFNAGYLAERLNAGSIADAVTRAQSCAALVIQHRGAIVDKHLFQDANI
ncbi:sugar kinase [Glaciecola sp. MH2013]|uniref:sugar kinase n=1 Tax=Glaciecola sp. MH2013 TaxID=2785524 RepID=UPI00189CC83F|nr:sugar kinase [Glaciecola sp. MH2013]MBF7073673.1 sugar kinase [Glaciecola sp. MH2013]